MNAGTFFPNNSKLLAPTAFRFVLNRELRHAMRANGCLSLVTIETTRDLGGTFVSADDETMHEIAQALSDEMRDRDLLGYTDAGTLSLVLRSTDYQRSMRVVDRIMAKLEQFDYAGATALAGVMLIVSFTILIAINTLAGRSQRRRREPPTARPLVVDSSVPPPVAQVKAH